MNYSDFYNYTPQTQCGICYGVNPDFEKAANEHYHLACLVYYSASNPNFFNLSSHVSNDIIIPIQSCYTCKSDQDLSSCPQCNFEFCFSCTLKPGIRVCCENFKNQFKSIAKKCIGCFYVKPNSEFCYRFKCKDHDYLCLKCWSFGKTQGRCVFGCVINTQWACYTKCLMCHEWRPKYLGEYRCTRNCEICDLCGYKRAMEDGKPCSICLKEISLAF